MARRRQYRGSGRQGGYTASERAAVPTSMFLKPETRSWPVGDRRHVSIALQYMQRGFGNRSEYPQYLARLLQIWPPDQHPDVLEELEKKLPSIANMMSPVRAAANPTSIEAEIQRMLDNPPFSWEDMMRQYGLSAGVSPKQFYSKILEFTPSMNRYGPKGGSGHVPPDEVRQAALLGLRLSYKNDYTSASGIGVARAVQLALAPSVWDRTITRMNAYFMRHRKDQQAKRFGDLDDPSRGFMAWLNWGGDPGWEWARQQLGVAQPNPRRRSRAKTNPDKYPPDVESFIAEYAVLQAARATLGASGRSTNEKLKSFRELTEAIKGLKGKRGKRHTIEKVVEKWARSNLRASVDRNMFREELARASAKLRRDVRGITALPPKPFMDEEGSEDGENTDPRREALRLVYREKKPFHQAYPEQSDDERRYRLQVARGRAGLDEDGYDPSAEAGRVAEAAKRLGWKRLPPLHHGEQTHWVCAAEPDEEKCKRVIVFEKVPISPLDMGEMDDDDLPEDGNYPVGVQYVREPLWWYDLNVMPYSAKDEVRSRLGADWVYTANKHDARRFFGDIAAHPSATLDWLDERTPSRRAVEKSLRNFVATLPVSHDYSARPTPRWIERLKGHHVENENEVKVGGKRYGWCFGGIHNATYMAMIDDDHELYFAMVRDRPVAIFIKRDTQGQTYDADLNQWSAASIYQDEYGPFALIEAKYPHNDEAIRDVKAVLRGMEYTPDYGGKTKKTIRRRRGNARRNPDRYSDDIEYYMAEAAVEDAAAVATRHIWEHGGRDSAKKSDRASRAMHETLFVADGAPDRLDALVKGVSMWVNTYLRTPEERSAFSRDLKNNIRRYRKAMRGVMALSKAEREKVGARELVRLVKRQMLEGGSFGKGSFPAAYGAFADQRRERTRESRRYHAKARMEQKGKRTRRKPRMARAAMALGYTRLPPLVFEEDAHWVCAAEPDEGKCRHVTTREHEKNQPTWQSPFEVKYVKEPLWWYNLDVIPEDSRAEVRSRLGADWVYLANKHDVRSFLPDLGANPTEVLAWMGERKPSRKMVEKNLRRYVRTLPVEHDFSDRSVPQWVRRLGGRHVENERDLKIVGRPNGWCFGSQFAGKYLSDLDRGYHLYFLNLNGELAAVWVNRTNLSTGTGDVFKDELGIFRLSEAKYPGNEEAYHDIVEVLRHDANVQELPDFQVEREFQETEGEIFMPDLTDIPDGDDDPNDLVLEL